MSGELYNIYCDESCHLEHDRIPVMVVGAVWCKTAVVRQISGRIREIKHRHGVPPGVEIKWSKVSPSKRQLYLDLIDYFFNDDDLHFRGVLIPDKAALNHAAFDQTHDTWYYKMCFRMIEPIIDPTQRYRVYLDIKDTRSEQKRRKLEEVLRNARYDPRGHVIERVQQIRSHESALMQLADLLIGAIAYHNRKLETNGAKLEVIRRIQQRSSRSLDVTTWLREPKLNLLRWQARGPGNA
jgi:hypothetical protein